MLSIYAYAVVFECVSVQTIIDWRDLERKKNRKKNKQE